MCSFGGHEGKSTRTKIDMEQPVSHINPAQEPYKAYKYYIKMGKQYSQQYQTIKCFCASTLQTIEYITLSLCLVIKLEFTIPFWF